MRPVPARSCIIREKRSTAFRVFLRMAGSCLVFDVERFKLVLVREEGVIEAWCIGRGEQGDVAALG